MCGYMMLFFIIKYRAHRVLHVITHSFPTRRSSELRREGFTDDRPVLYEPQNIHAILGHVREIAKSGFARDLTVRELYDPSLPEVSGSRDGLIQLLLNLLKNAAEADRKSVV